MGALGAKRAAFVCALYAALSLLICAPLFEQPNGVGHFDWDQHLFYYASVLKSVIEYAQWPFWNPWYCGGNVLWQNPQVALLSPAYPLALVLSLPLAMKVNIVLHYWIGFIGMHLVLRRMVHVRSMPLVIYLSCVFVAGGALALHVAEGHSTMLPAFYLPLQLFWFCRAMSGGTIRDALLAAAVAALTVINGGLHIVPVMIVGFGTLALVAAATQRSWRPVLALVVIGAAGIAYAAPKLVPMVAYIESESFRDHRPLGVRDAMTVKMVEHAYLDSHQTRRSRFGDHEYGWHEYGNYIGAPAVLLMIAALLWALVRPPGETRWLGMSLALASVMLFALSLGNFSAIAPAALMRGLPLFSRFRLPSRYTIGFALFATTTAGWALHDLSWDVVRSRRGQIVVAALCALASFDLIWRNGSHFVGVFDQRPLDHGFSLLRRSAALVTDTSIDAMKQDAPMLRALMNDRSTFNCYESLRLNQIADPAKPLVFSDGPLQVASSRFTPNRIDVAVVGGPDASRLFVNQNYASGWRSTLGPVAADPHYRNIAVSVPARAAGTHSIVFTPPGLTFGFVVFALAILASVRFLRR
jgi:hypothetical protein